MTWAIILVKWQYFLFRFLHKYQNTIFIHEYQRMKISSSLYLVKQNQNN